MVEFQRRFSEKLSNYTNANLEELAKRYAHNIANGRFLWRNRVGAQDIKVFVSHSSLSSPLEFNAYDFSLNDTTADDASINVLAQLIKAGLAGNEIKNAYAVNWQFTTEDARIKLKRLYPTIKDKINLME